MSRGSWDRKPRPLLSTPSRGVMTSSKPRALYLKKAEPLAVKKHKKTTMIGTPK